MNPRLLPLLPPGAVIHMDAAQFLDLVEEIRSLRREQAEFRAFVGERGLTRQQIAEATGRSVHTVGEWVRDGKLSGGRRYHLAENALTGLTTIADVHAFLAHFKIQ